MNKPIRASLGALAPLVACLGLALLSSPALAAEGTAAYQPEALTAFELQLKTGQIQEATINKRVRSLRLTLKDGRHLLAKYQPREEPKVLAELTAKGVHVNVLSKAQAVKEAKKTVHHKLRYIAGGIAIVIVVVVGAVLLIDRRRKLAAD